VIADRLLLEGESYAKEKNAGLRLHIINQRWQVARGADQKQCSGAALLDVIEAGEMNFGACFEHEQRQRQVIEDLLEHISVWHMAGQEVESGARGKACQVFQTLLDELDACGIYVFGGRSNKSHLSETKSREGTLIFKRADDPQIIQPRLLRQFGKAMCLITVPVDR